MTESQKPLVDRRASRRTLTVAAALIVVVTGGLIYTITYLAQLSFTAGVLISGICALAVLAVSAWIYYRESRKLPGSAAYEAERGVEKVGMPWPTSLNG